MEELSHWAMARHARLTARTSASSVMMILSNSCVNAPVRWLSE
jgi:uncharacterized protein (UPF0548 family)